MRKGLVGFIANCHLSSAQSCPRVCSRRGWCPCQKHPPLSWRPRGQNSSSKSLANGLLQLSISTSFHPAGIAASPNIGMFTRASRCPVHLWPPSASLSRHAAGKRTSMNSSWSLLHPLHPQNYSTHPAPEAARWQPPGSPHSPSPNDGPQVAFSGMNWASGNGRVAQAPQRMINNERWWKLWAVTPRRCDMPAEVTWWTWGGTPRNTWSDESPNIANFWGHDWDVDLSENRAYPQNPEDYSHSSSFLHIMKVYDSCCSDRPICRSAVQHISPGWVSPDPFPTLFIAREVCSIA